MEEICSVRKVDNNATQTVEKYLVSSPPDDNGMKVLKEQLRQATDDDNFEEMVEITQKLKAEKEKHSSWKDPSKFLEQQPLPRFPHYFRIAKIKGFDKEKKVLHLLIGSFDYPISVCGDSCKTNLKAQRLMEEEYGIVSPFSNCSSHVASGTIRRSATSETMCDENVKKL